MAWWEGEDVDPDSGLSHITKAIATLVVLRDSQINLNVDDDRPIRPNPKWSHYLQKRMDDVNERLRGKESKAPYLEAHQILPVAKEGHHSSEESGESGHDT